jgi:hypothetical protein
MATITNKFKIPSQVVSAILRDPYKRVGNISATSLIQSPRIFQLRKRHENEIEEDASERIWALLGQIGHKILERADDTGAIHEERISAMVSGWELSGQSDCYVTHETEYAKNGDATFKEIKPTIRDYKFIKVVAGKFDHPEWEQQLNILAYLWRTQGFAVERLEIVAIFRDWGLFQYEKQTRENPYPPPVKVYKQSLWSQGEAEMFVKARVKAHQMAGKLPDDLLPFCTPEEQWRRDPKWAVMSNRVTRAKKLCNSNAEAEKFIKDNHQKITGLFIEYRPGVAVRCESYCDVRKWCNQFEMETRNKAREEAV